MYNIPHIFCASVYNEDAASSLLSILNYSKKVCWCDLLGNGKFYAPQLTSIKR